MSQQDFQEKTKNKNGGTDVGQKIKDQYSLKTLRRNWQNNWK